MSVATFANEAFSPAAYLDAELATEDTLDAASRLLASLEVSTRTCNTQLSDLVDSMLRSGPRLSYELDLLQSETTSFSQRVMSQQGAIDAISESGDAIAELQGLEEVKAKMEEVVHVFVDAQEWISNPANADEEIQFLVESGETERAKTRVEHMRRLAGLWKGTAVQRSANDALARWESQLK